MEKYINKRRGDDGLLVYYISSTSCCGRHVEWRRGEAPDECPFCGNKYWRKPNLEMRLFTLQDEFVEDFNRTGSTRILGERMFPVILEYAENLIKALLRGRHSLDNDELKARAWDAATMLVEVIMREDDHRMRYSFGDYLGRLCKSVCYITKNHDRTYSLNAMLPDGKTEVCDRITASLDDASGGRGVDSMSVATEMGELADGAEDRLLASVARSADEISRGRGRAARILYLLGLLLDLKGDAKASAEFSAMEGDGMAAMVARGRRIVYEDAMGMEA